MEQAVWIYFGVVTVILGFGIVGKLIIEHKDQQKDDLFDRSLEALQGQCNFVCDSPAYTKLSTEVELPSGLVLNSLGNKICGDYFGERRCVNCNCELRDYTLNLNTTIALSTFETHNYRCYFERGEDDLRMDCQG